jgi:transcriptional regulator with XRE-family HTH domain
MRTVGFKIGKIRLEKDLTQLQLAQKAKVSILRVQYWESGKSLTLKSMLSLSHILNQPMEAFFEDPLETQEVLEDLSEPFAPIPLNKSKPLSVPWFYL